MASGERPAGPDQAGLATRVVVALGRPVSGPGAPRVESIERVMRMWEMLNGIGDELKPQTLSPQTMAHLHQLFKDVTAELERSVSPALGQELRHLIDGTGAHTSASEVRIEYASLLGWLGGLVISMYSQLEDSKRELATAAHPASHSDGHRGTT
jgi:Bacterial proteasome activator